MNHCSKMKETSREIVIEVTKIGPVKEKTYVLNSFSKTNYFQYVYGYIEESTEEEDLSDSKVKLTLFNEHVNSISSLGKYEITLVLWNNRFRNYTSTDRSRITEI